MFTTSLPIQALQKRQYTRLPALPVLPEGGDGPIAIAAEIFDNFMAVKIVALFRCKILGFF